MLSLKDLSPAAREIMAELTLSPDNKKELMIFMADWLTYEKAQDLLLSIIESTDDYEEHHDMDKFLWVTRMAYLSGFRAAADKFSEAFELELREGDNA